MTLHIAMRNTFLFPPWPFPAPLSKAGCALDESQLAHQIKPTALFHRYVHTTPQD